MFDPDALMLLAAANGAPVLAALLLGRRWAWPLDAGRCFIDGRPLLGAHKTWRGLAAGTLAAALVGSAMHAGFWLGAAFGALALVGDLVSSFTKRRLDRLPGQESLLLDPLPESLLPLLALRRLLDLGLMEIVGTALLFAVLDFAVTRAWHALRR